MAGFHHGVVAIVTNAARTRFFLQQKDEHYEPFPLGYSLFGGAIEEGEDLGEALARELREELGPAAHALIDATPQPIFLRRTMTEGFVLSLFELVLDDPILDALARTPVLEGKRGVVLRRAELRATPLIWGLQEIVLAYLERHAEDEPSPRAGPTRSS
ncbi:NUDIX hydrolase [Paraliomyxa miuraensis]|uniref:NUDIX hydrolase n=1 Tax=Paraliomyxa miuraensis TaxID=376150 RepID=UPI002258DF39|nr:NUDIX hydrolase [Paraliomyxa miuraensis]MCX4243583.1 NUDIX hydrolase [Paraliomyxa miuraensis]